MTTVGIFHDDHPMHHPATAHENVAAAGPVDVIGDDDPSITVPVMAAVRVADVPLFDTNDPDFGGVVVIVDVDPSVVNPVMAAAGAVVVMFDVVPASMPVIVAAVFIMDVDALYNHGFTMSRMSAFRHDNAAAKDEARQPQNQMFHRSLRLHSRLALAAGRRFDFDRPRDYDSGSIPFALQFRMRPTGFLKLVRNPANLGGFMQRRVGTGG
jgi:hypothetical protein